jgi:hypothetical protein
VENEARLEYVGERLNASSTQLCLLIPEARWHNVMAMEAHPGSNFRRLKQHPGSVSVLLWEDLIRPKAVMDEVRSYVVSALDHPRLRKNA